MVAITLHTKIIWALLAMIPTPNGAVVSHFLYDSEIACTVDMNKVKHDNPKALVACVMGDMP